MNTMLHYINGKYTNNRKKVNILITALENKTGTPGNIASPQKVIKHPNLFPFDNSLPGVHLLIVFSVIWFLLLLSLFPFIYVWFPCRNKFSFNGKTF